MPFLRALSDNLAAGLRLAMFLPVRRGDFRIALDQVIALVALVTIISIGLGYHLTDPPRAFDADYLSNVALVYLVTIVAAYFVALLHRTPWQTLDLLTVLAAATIWTAIVTLLGGTWVIQLMVGEYAWFGQAFSLTLLGWSIVVTFRSIRVTWRAGLGRAFLSLAFILGTSFGAVLAFPPVQPWHTVVSTDAAPLPRISVEETYRAQQSLLSNLDASLGDQRPGHTDLYFVGFGGYAHQDVFMREVLSVRDLFDQRFDTGNRSIALINNSATLDAVPVASVSNLEDALGMVGRRIDPDEDVVFLFLTSHGSADPALSVEFRPLGLKQLTPVMLKGMLDRAGIKWRVVVVSACYSGGFIEPLKDDHSLIITAARADRRSFGCTNENRYTNFGEAYFDQQLRQETSFTEAFHGARAAIQARETAEGLTPPSEPQMFVGRAIEAKLAHLEARLRDYLATTLRN